MLVNRALRHDKFLPANKLGFAWAEDLSYVLARPPYRLREPTVAELLLTVVNERAGRFQVASRNGTAAKGDIVIRCAQGHSGLIWELMETTLPVDP